MSAGFLAPIHRLGLSGQSYIPILSPDSNLCAVIAVYAALGAGISASAYLSGEPITNSLYSASIETSAHLSGDPLTNSLYDADIETRGC